MADIIFELKAENEQLKEKLAEARGEIDELKSSTEDAAGSTGSLGGATDDLTAAQERSQAKIAELHKSLDDLEGTTTETSEGTDLLGGRMATMSIAAGAAVIAAKDLADIASDRLGPVIDDLAESIGIDEGVTGALQAWASEMAESRSPFTALIRLVLSANDATKQLQDIEEQEPEVIRNWAVAYDLLRLNDRAEELRNMADRVEELDRRQRAAAESAAALDVRVRGSNEALQARTDALIQKVIELRSKGELTDEVLANMGEAAAELIAELTRVGQEPSEFIVQIAEQGEKAAIALGRVEGGVAALYARVRGDNKDLQVQADNLIQTVLLLRDEGELTNEVLANLGEVAAKLIAELTRVGMKPAEFIVQLAEQGEKAAIALGRVEAQVTATTEAVEAGKHWHDQYVEALGEGTEEASDRAVDALAEFEKQGIAIAERVADVVDRVADSVRRAQELTVADTDGPSSDGRIRDLEDQRDRVAELREEQANATIVSLEGTKELEEAERRLGELEFQLGDAREDQSREAVAQTGQQVRAQEQLAGVIDDARAAVDGLGDTWGTAGEQAAGHVREVIALFEQQQALVGVSGEEVQAFGEVFEESMRLAVEQARALTERQRELEEQQRTQAEAVEEASTAFDEQTEASEGLSEGLDKVKDSGEAAKEEVAELSEVSFELTAQRVESVNKLLGQTKVILGEINALAAQLPGII
jgi:hypothetical protein